MARPTRTFTGQEGQRATGSAGPDPIRRDFDAAFAMFNPEATLPTGEAGGIDLDENCKAVLLDQNQEPEADAGKAPRILSWIVNRIKAITGMPDWKNTPPTTIAGLHSQVSNVRIDQNLEPTADVGNLQQVVSWLANRIKEIIGKDDWKADPGVSLQDISQAATHDDISFHAVAKSGVHGVGNAFVAKTSRSDQWPSWNDIPDKPTSFPVGPHQHSAQDIITGQLPPERIGNLPASKITSGQFDPERIPNLPASKITSGTFDRARLPAASTSQPGIVQLTNSRSSTSETLAVTAAALNAHRTSADHDDRYYTKPQVDQLVSVSGGQWMLPGNTILAEVLGERSVYVSVYAPYETTSSGSRSIDVKFWVPNPGSYRITGEVRNVRHFGGSGDTSGSVQMMFGNYAVSTSFGTTSSSYVSFTLDMLPGIAIPAYSILALRVTASGYAQSSTVSGTTYVRNVRLRGVTGSKPSLSYVGLG